MEHLRDINFRRYHFYMYLFAFEQYTSHSSFPVMHKVGNVVNFVLLHSEG